MQPRLTAPGLTGTRPAMPAPIELFYDFGSPYSYFAMRRVDEVRARTHRELLVRPFLLGGVFKLAGNVMPASSPPKAKYLLDDLRRWSTFGEVPFQFNPAFAWNSLQQMRVMMACFLRDPARHEAAAQAHYLDLWRDARDPNDGSFLRAAVSRAGFDADAVFAEATTERVKEALKAATQEAVDRGAFGAPTFFADGRMFWGHDRLDLLVECVLRDVP
jgi:2-hydroxychromene-2-carboxylate isomerase